MNLCLKWSSDGPIPHILYIHMYAMLRLQQLHRHERKRAHGQEMVERMKEIYTQTRRGSKQTI